MEHRYVHLEKFLTPTVDFQALQILRQLFTGTWGGDMLGDDHLSVTVNGIVYSSEFI
jgi:hypothetical protein